jgi:branched-chain amino acid transport system ATP-binding protein
MIMLDEPPSVRPILVDRIFEVITRLNKEGLPILLVEQNVFPLSASRRGYVIEREKGPRGQQLCSTIPR